MLLFKVTTRAWSVASNFSYEINKSLTPFISAGNENGLTLLGGVTVQRSLSEHLSAELGYRRMHQSYGGVLVLSQTPGSDREYASISYQFARPLGR
jgi:hypothetical protein